LGTEVEAEVVGCVRFIDGGQQDDKWILKKRGSPSKRERFIIHRFFQIYAALKRISAPLRGVSCQSELLSIEYYI
jgi:hypothetical protein